jgi:cell division protein FtsA
MPKPRIHVGLEIGTSKVGFVVGETRPDGGIKILGLSHVPSRGVLKGEIVDADAARACVGEALQKVEEESGHDVRDVHLAVKGGHAGGTNVTRELEIPAPPGQVGMADVEELFEAARDVTLPPDQALVHTLPRTFRLDGRPERNPVGQFGRHLEGDFHLVHGDKSRIHQRVRCVTQLTLGVEEIVFSPLAAAQVVLGEAQKQQGSVLIDLGGGTTDYVLYVDGAPAASGSVAVGGDHVTNDLALVLEIPLRDAETCKVKEGSVYFDARAVARGTTAAVPGQDGREIDVNLMNHVIHLRVREILDLVKARLDATGLLEEARAGVFLTGGGSQLRGVAELAGKVFRCTVNDQSEAASPGNRATQQRPQYATLIGLVRHAQVREWREQARRGPLPWGKRLGHWLGVA